MLLVSVRGWVDPRIVWKKNSNDTIGNRTRDLPLCSAVPQPTALPRALCWLQWVSDMQDRKTEHQGSRRSWRNVWEQNCTLLGCYAVNSINSLTTFRDKLQVLSRPLKLRPTGCTETSVRNYYYYYYSLRNSPEGHSSHLLDEESLLISKYVFCFLYQFVCNSLILLRSVGGYLCEGSHIIRHEVENRLV